MSRPRSLYRMCKFPTPPPMLVSEFPDRADFSPLRSRLWKIHVRRLAREPRRRVRQTIETLDVSQNLQAQQFERVRGDSFAHCFRLDSQNPRDEHRNEAVGWRLSHCWWGTPACWGRLRQAGVKSHRVDPVGFALQGSLRGCLHRASVSSLPRVSNACAPLALGERSSFFSLVSVGARAKACDSAEPGRTCYKVSDFVVREVDFVGWYRDGRVAGAVLAQGFEEPGADASCRIVERVTRVLSERVPRSVVGRLRVRVVKLGSQSK